MIHSGSALIDASAILDKLEISEGHRIADFGCGRTGHFVFPCSQIVGDQGVVYAVDILKSVLESIKSMAASEGYDNIQTVWSDIEKNGKTPIPDKSLDTVFFLNVLSQLKNRSSALQEAARLLKKNGLLVIIEWKKKLGPLGPEDDKIVSVEEVSQIAQDCDLQIRKSESIGEYNYLIILDKS